MANDSTLQCLNVFLHDLYVGKLCSDNAELSFIYDSEYLNRKEATKLSASLPLQKESFGHSLTSAFFSGLLPDEQVRERLARYLQISKKNTFALLKEIGGECAGAVSVHLEGRSPDRGMEPQFLVLENNKAHHILSALDKRPMMAGEEDIRISGAGAQNKLVIAFVNGYIAVPKRNTPSTHIIKPAIRDLQDTVQNEFFCMKLAQAVGLPVPEASIYWLQDSAYYLVERYDRRRDDEGHVIRRHQEDFCQAMHIAPEMKYENEGGPTLKQCFSLLDGRIQLGVMAGKNKMTLLQGIIFNFLIGNGDAHGKNFSLLYEGESESLAPFYDLMCTVIYTDVFSAKMSMKIGSKYKFQDVTIRHFEQLAESIGVRNDFMLKQLTTLSRHVRTAAVELEKRFNNDPKTASGVYAKIVEVVMQHAKRIDQGG